MKEYCKICGSMVEPFELGGHIMEHGRNIQESLMGKMSDSLIKQALHRVYYYGMKYGDTYEKEIKQFFSGKSYYEERTVAHIWVANHIGFDTLTVEPYKEGGQYEIAVRIRQPDGTYAGYWLREGELVGVNTDGH